MKTDRSEAGVADRLRDRVRPDEGRVPAFVHNDPGVYDLEMQRVFRRCWLFVAHESEIPDPGDYVTREMGDDPVIVARGEDGGIHVLLNACRHRGMRICRSDLGNSSHFRCPYHGFTYRNDGQLIGVPYQDEAYGDALDRGRLGLVAARVETYHGLIFATWAEDAEPLGRYLGHMRWYLDLLVRRASMEVVGTPIRREVATGWKLPAENFASDAYHTMFSHGSIAKIGLAPRLDFSRRGYQIQAGGGHGLGFTTPTESLVFPEELLPAYRERLSADQFEALKRLRNVHGLVFPNLSFQISTITYGGRLVSHTSFNLYLPRGPGRIEALSWFLVERDAPDGWKEASRRMFVLTFSPSGIFEQDDVENFTDITGNARSLAVRELEFHYGMGVERRPVEGFPGPGTVYESKYSEANARAFYRRWLELMLAAGGGGVRGLDGEGD